MTLGVEIQALFEKCGDNKVRITYNKEVDTLPSWSADNKKILTTSYRNGNYEICELTIPDTENFLKNL